MARNYPGEFHRRGNHASGPSIKMNMPLAFQSKLDILDHLTGAHFEHKEVGKLLGSLLDDLLRKGPERNRADQPYPQPFLPQTLDRSLRDSRGNAISKQSHISI